MNHLFARIAAQRARAGRVAVMAFLAGALLYLGHQGHVGPLPVPLFTGLLYAAFVTPAAVLTAVFLPALVALSDAAQWSRLGLAMVTAAFPATLRPLVDQPLIGATGIILCAMGLVAAGKHLAGAPRFALA